MSVAPLVVVALWVMGLVVGDDEVRRTASRLGELAPRRLGVDRAFARVADVGTRLGVLAVLAALWPATAYGSGLVRVFDRIGPGAERELKGLRGRAMALALVGLVPVLALASLVAAYLGLRAFGDSALEKAAGVVVALASCFAVTTVAAMVVYKVFPHEPPRWPSALRGTLVAAGGISLVSVGYGAYLRHGADFERRYASDALAAVVLLGVWLFLANLSLLVGFKVATRLSRPGTDGAA